MDFIFENKSTMKFILTIGFPKGPGMCDNGRGLNGWGWILELGSGRGRDKKLDNIYLPWLCIQTTPNHCNMLFQVEEKRNPSLFSVCMATLANSARWSALSLEPTLRMAEAMFLHEENERERAIVVMTRLEHTSHEWADNSPYGLLEQRGFLCGYCGNGY